MIMSSCRDLLCPVLAIALYTIQSIALWVQAMVQEWVESIIVMVTDCNVDVPEARMEAVDHVVEKGLHQWVNWNL